MGRGSARRGRRRAERRGEFEMVRRSCVAAAAMVAMTVTGPAFGQDVSASLFAAHRGGSLLWPENSLLAFRHAAALGADYLELDVHLSKDAQVVVIHDPTLDRTTTGTGPVRERALAELKALRLT